ncbi:MAG: aspartate aminotransferase family protein [Rhodothermales bacterium]
MTSKEAIEREDRFQIPTYNKMPVVLVRGEGSFVWDVEGRKLLDLYGGHCVALLGHSPGRVVHAVKKQVDDMLFYSNAVYSGTRARAAERLAGLAPEGLRHAFFCNSGSEANETALKLARKHTGRSGMIAMHDGFHGRTLASLAVTSSETYRAPYQAILPPTTFVPFGDAAAVEDAFRRSDDIAGVILEPIQSMAGVVEADASYYRDIRKICDRNDAVLIFDEVQTGVGRTGTFSVSEQYGMCPDLITLAKSLGAGIPVGAVLVSDEIAGTVEPGDQGSTFGGGMVAMAAVEATLQTLVDEDLMPRAAKLFDRVAGGLNGLVADVRGRGGLIGLVLDEPAAPVRSRLLAHDILTGSAADPNVIRLMPPINTPFEAIDAFVDVFERIVTSEPSASNV